jgi:hypothetical protein
LNVAPAVSDETLQSVSHALVEKAKAGDVEAAAFVFELARIQQSAAVKGTSGVAGKP